VKDVTVLIGSRVPSIPSSIQRQGQQSVPFSPAFATLRLSNFRSTFACFFLQFSLQISNILFKTDDTLSGHDGKLIRHYQDFVLGAVTL
jgi:hypothetical protein